MTSTRHSPATGTVHLARLRLSARSRLVHQDLRDAASIHRRVQSLFPDTLGEAPRAATQTLYRLEREHDQALLLIQSALPINRNALPSGYAETVEYRDLTPLLDWLAEGRLVRYRLDANPVKAVRNQDSRKRGQRIPLTGEDAISWWHRKAQQAGLVPALVLDVPQPPVTAYRGPDTKRATLRVIRFEGIATVTDPDAARKAVIDGIGQGRAYGLGLLSLAVHHP